MLALQTRRRSAFRQAVDCSSLLSLAFVTGDMHQFRQRADSLLTDYLWQVLEEFREQMSVGSEELGLPVLDPLDIGVIKIEERQYRVDFSNVSLVGLSEFDIDRLDVCLEQLVLDVTLVFPHLRITGAYRLNGRAARIMTLSGDGNFWVKLDGVTITGKATLVYANGTFRVESLDLDLKVRRMSLHFENLFGGGMLGSVVNGIASKLSKNIFDRVKPNLLTSVESSLRTKLNAELKRWVEFVPDELVAMIGGGNNRLDANQYIDDILAVAREQICQNELDPFPLPDSDSLTQGQLFGLATVYRSGDATISTARGGSILEVRLGLNNVQMCYCWTKRLVCHFTGQVSARARNVVVYMRMKHPSSTSSSSSPELEVVDIEQFGRMIVHMSGLGPITWVMEKMVTLSVNIRKHQLAEKFALPIRQVIESSMRNARMQCGRSN